MDCETNDCQREKRTCKGCYFEDKQELKVTRNINKKICKNCKFFERIYNCKFYGECNNPKMEYETGLGYEQKQKENNKKIEKDKLFYMDYEWYNADIEVAKNLAVYILKTKNRKLV